MKKKVLIIHYNTPLLTECLVKSINKHVKDAYIYIFDNSDVSPFKNKFDNVEIIDNTKGQIINFAVWLKKYPNRFSSNGKVNGFGSAKHCISVEKAMKIIGDNFVLLDSDVLITRDFSNLYNDKVCYISEVKNQPGSKIVRSLPFICYINYKMCEKSDVHYFNENYMHGLNYKKNNARADFYDTGAYFYLSASKLLHKEIKYKDYVVHFGSGSWEESKNKHFKKNALTKEEWLMVNKRFWDDESMKKAVIYTCITGGYDYLSEPKFVGNYDFICFTDNKDIKSTVWKIRDIPEDLKSLSKVKQQRCVKICPHKYLKEYDVSVWVDGCVEILSDPVKVINEALEKAPIGIPKHPIRNCIYEEMKACLRIKKDTAENMNPQIERYRKEGFPKAFGLPQSNIIIRRHNDEDCIKIMDTWCEELKNGSHRDQLSFSYAVWKNDSNSVCYLDKNLYESKYFHWRKAHGKSRKQDKRVSKHEYTIQNESKNEINASNGQDEFKKEVEAFTNTPKHIIHSNGSYSINKKRREISKKLKIFVSDL